jgi:hypothetical protein
MVEKIEIYFTGLVEVVDYSTLNRVGRLDYDFVTNLLSVCSFLRVSPFSSHILHHTQCAAFPKGL